MAMDIHDGIWDYMSETTVSTVKSSNDTYSARVTFMDGVTEVEFMGVEAVATNSQLTMNPEGPIAVSKNATVFYDRFSIELDWMKYVKTLHDPLHLDPSWSYTIELHAEDFEAPKGFSATSAELYFVNSLFTTVPRFYSDELMAELTVWPPLAYQNDSSNQTSFYLDNCPNVNKVAPQGQLGDNLRVLYLPREFTYVQDGKRMLDAFPTGGAPEAIVSTIGAMTLGWEDVLPSWDLSNLKLCVGLLDNIELVAKKGTTPSIPLLGVDFASLTKVESMSFGFNLTIEEDYESDIVVTTGSLGIVLPDSVTEAPGAWRMWQHSTGSGKETHVATPQGLRALELDAWADALEDYVGDRLTADAMPITPPNLVDARGYYMKYITSFDHNDTWTVDEGPQDRMAHEVSLAAKIMIDGVQSQFTIQPLPSTVEYADFYAAGTYQHSEVVTDITVPAIPSSATTVNGAYMRTFYQAVGAEVKSAEVEFPQMVLTRVYHTAKGALYECTKPADVKLDQTYDALYEVALREGIEPTTAPFPELGYSYDLRGDSGYSETEVSYSSEYMPGVTADTSRNEDYNGLGLLHVIRDWMKNTVVKGRYVTAEITNSIVLEREPLPNVSSAKDFQLETFYGSGVMPDRVNCLIPVSGTVPTGRSYQSAINVKPVRESTVAADAIYNWKMPGEANMVDLSRYISTVLLLRYHTALLRPELQKYTFNSDELIISAGLTGTDESFIGMLPTTTKFSSPLESFASSHGIGSNLATTLYLSGMFTGNPRWTLMAPMILWRFEGAWDTYFVKTGFSYDNPHDDESGYAFQAPSNDVLDVVGNDYGKIIDPYAVYLHTQDGQKSFIAAHGG